MKLHRQVKLIVYITGIPLLFLFRIFHWITFYGSLDYLLRTGAHLIFHQSSVNGLIFMVPTSGPYEVDPYLIGSLLT